MQNVSFSDLFFTCRNGMFDVQVACCCGSAACSLLCRACGSCNNSSVTRIVYALVLLAGTIVACIMLAPGLADELGKVLLLYFDGHYDNVSWCYSSHNINRWQWQWSCCIFVVSMLYLFTVLCLAYVMCYVICRFPVCVVELEYLLWLCMMHLSTVTCLLDTWPCIACAFLWLHFSSCLWSSWLESVHREILDLPFRMGKLWILKTLPVIKIFDK